ncbi:MAG: imidazole glycerol phosphate synthase subunit HisH [Acidobacteria bacterium]|nr:MAG: imidazole glycerol phosphate synthase subunit HisH [Acidobacteriota bacterium]REK07782.1 MAG: imidazole glycerol phosphate synthase subunit HisH [Acidobacteriota bacterium]
MSERRVSSGPEVARDDAVDVAAAGRGSASVQIVDLGVGNLGNLQRAVAVCGWRAAITTDPGAVQSARAVLLPGVGAFRPPREALRGELERALRQALADGAWLLGICVGFQLLYEGSEEFGDCDGLALLRGTVRRLPESVPLPHIGWNALRAQDWSHPLLAGVAPGAHAYFVHSFAADAATDEEIVATCLHGREFPAIAGRGRVFGTQFHPEKSGEAVGLRVLTNFLRLAGADDAHAGRERAEVTSR